MSEHDVEVGWEIVLTTFAQHRNLMRSPNHPVCDRCAEPFPCATYQLARIVHNARAVVVENHPASPDLTDISAALWPSPSSPGGSPTA